MRSLPLHGTVEPPRRAPIQAEAELSGLSYRRIVRRAWPAAHGLLAAFLLAGLTSGCGGERGSADFASLRGDTNYNVLVVTLDTVRADRLGPYGFAEVATPAMDRLAREGILFENAHSTTPLTLPAHTSLFTGNYPLRHGVIDNGGFLVPQEANTLAEVLGEAGYRTGGFVAAYVLDRRWQLDQGFDRYVDDFDVRGQRVIAMGSVQRPANEVVDRALEWLDEPSDKPFFLWTHFYDPHAPYEAPEPFASRYASRPYLGEIAFTDSQIGRLLEELERRQLLESTIVVVVADHGESLGEHGEAQHGFFVYDAVTHVPLIIRLPFGSYGGRRRAALVSIVDVMPTVLEAAGVSSGLEFHGQSLVPQFDNDQPPAARYVYSESWYARLHYGWSELRAVRDERYKLILSSEPELYDLQEDPGETRNQVDTLNSVLFRMSRAADELIAGWSVGAIAEGAPELDEETRRKLVSLGYVGSFQVVGDDSADLPSPRTKIDIYNKSLEARQAMNRDEYDEAEKLLREVLAQDPGIVDAFHTLGELYFSQGRLEEAVAAYRAAVPLKPEDPYAYIFMTDALVGLGRLDEAEAAVRDGLEFIDANAQLYFLLGDVLRRQGELEGAVAAFLRCIELNPDGSAAHGGLAQVYFQQDRFEAAEQYGLEGLARNDRLLGVHSVLAEIYDARGESDAAVREYQQELELSPQDVAANFNLAMVYRKMGREGDEHSQLERVLELDPGYPLGNLFMARLMLAQGDRYRQAIAMVEAAISQSLDTPDLTLGYFLLADLYGRVGETSKAQEWARRGQLLQDGH